MINISAGLICVPFYVHYVRSLLPFLFFPNGTRPFASETESYRPAFWDVLNIWVTLAAWCNDPGQRGDSQWHPIGRETGTDHGPGGNLSTSWLCESKIMILEFSGGNSGGKTIWDENSNPGLISWQDSHRVAPASLYWTCCNGYNYMISWPLWSMLKVCVCISFSSLVSRKEAHWDSRPRRRSCKICKM